MRRGWGGFGLERSGCCESEGEAGAEGEGGEAVVGFGKQDGGCRWRLGKWEQVDGTRRLYSLDLELNVIDSLEER